MRLICGILLLLIIFPCLIQAQSPETGRIALYADALRTTSEVDLPNPYTPFDVYIFCQPGINGMYCAEFGLHSSTESMIIASTEWHPSTSVVLGDLVHGASVCLLECQSDWVLLARVSMLNSITDPSVLEIVRHPDVGYYQFASCLEGSPIEPVFIGPQFCFNQSCAQDTDPPSPVSVDVEDDRHLTVSFDEKIFEPDAMDPARYLIYRTDDPGDSIPVTLALLGGEEDDAQIALGSPMVEASYTLELVGMRDVIGNPSTPGTGISFAGMDTSPPEPLYAFIVGFSKVTVVFSEPLDEVSARDHTNYLLRCAECTFTPYATEARLLADGRSVSVAFSSVIRHDQIYDLWIEGIADLSGNVMAGITIITFSYSDGSPPSLREASFNNETSLDVIWSEPMDETSVEDVQNYSLFRNETPRVPLTLLSAERSSGGYHVRIYLSSATDLSEEHTLYSNNQIMDESEMYASATTFLIIPVDTIPPYMTSAECEGLSSIRVLFSEPIVNHFAGVGGHFSVYPTGSPDTPMAVAGVAWYGHVGHVRIDLVEAMTAGVQYTVRANDLDDPAGNLAPPHEMAIDCTDIYPPEVLEISLPDLTHVNILFNEMVNVAAADPASYLLYPAVDSAATVAIDSVAIHDVGTRAELVTASLLSVGEMYSLRMIGIGDLSGNMIDSDSTWSFLAVETVTPSLVSLSVTSDSVVVLEFDEALDPLTAEDVTKYAVVEAADTAVHLVLLSADIDAGGTMVDLEIEGKAPVGTVYKVLIRGVTDLSGNALYTESEEFEFIDVILPRLLSAEGPSARNAVVYFSEPVTLATTQVEGNYTLHVAGDSSAEIDVLFAERLPDQMSVNLTLGNDLEQHAFYTLKVSGINDFAGNTIIPDSTEFQYIDDKPPVILDIHMVNSLRLAVAFNEPVDSATAGDTGNYLIYLSADASQQIEVISVEWMDDEIRLNLAAEPIANVYYTVRIDGVEDRFHNLCSELEGSFRRVVNVPSANMALFVDEFRTTNEMRAEVQYESYDFYIFVEAGGNGVLGVEYALSPPETYLRIGHEVNPAWVASELGDPYGGHSVTLSECAREWIWIARVDCICFQPDEQEIVFIRPHPAASSVRIASCLPGNPLEGVRYAVPLLINVAYLDVMIENWDASLRDGSVELSWSIKETEATPVFEVSRTPDGSEEWQLLASDHIRADGFDFKMTDTDFEPGRAYRYRVESVEDDGRKVLFETDAIATPVMPFTLHQNSPNPFNPSTNISFYLPQAGHVRLEIFDVNGRLVDVLVDAQFASGEHSIDWDGRDRGGSSVSSGVYFYRLIAGKESLSRKMVLMR